MKQARLIYVELIVPFVSCVIPFVSGIMVAIFDFDG